jgi:hypothetical protein
MTFFRKWGGEGREGPEGDPPPKQEKRKERKREKINERKRDDRKKMEWIKAVLYLRSFAQPSFRGSKRETEEEKGVGHT